MTKRPNSVLITGASSGIGEALAWAVAAPDVMLFLSGRNAERLEQVATVCRQSGSRVETAILDVTDREAMDRWISAADDACPLDLVIANAGISGGSGAGTETTGDMRRIMEVNVGGILNTIDRPLQRMAARGYGQIALMASLAGYRGLPSAPAYSASKTAVRALGGGLRPVYATRNVRINVVCPGFVVSRITDSNSFPMPMLMPADKAARIILAGLARNRATIAFPWPMALSAWLLGALPDWAAAPLLKRLPAKSPDCG
ncbi:MAG: SDR family NAD(P)-dependent oxidoreductase [Rhodospirillales bacterium]